MTKAEEWLEWQQKARFSAINNYSEEESSVAYVGGNGGLELKDGSLGKDRIPDFIAWLSEMFL